MSPELNLDLARHHIADRLRRAEHRALVERQLDDCRRRPSRRGLRIRRRNVGGPARP